MFLIEMESLKMEDLQTKEEDDIIDKAKEVNEELNKDSEDTNEEGKSIPF